MIFSGLGVIKSISYNQQEIINNILFLNNVDKIDCDPMYGRGNFYKDGNIIQPVYCSDIKPLFEFVSENDAINIKYLYDGSIKCIILDPPFLVTTGKSLKEKNEGNIIAKRFSYLENIRKLYYLYFSILKEAYRVLEKNGICIFKCQDIVSSGKQYLHHVKIIQFAEEIGFYVKDLFILLSKHRLIANWQLENQRHARKYHCYFLVFEKKGVK